MSRPDKLLRQMKANPAADWQIGDVRTLCRQHGLIATAPQGGGSHYKIRKQGSRVILTIPVHRPIKAVYIRALVALIEESP